MEQTFSGEDGTPLYYRSWGSRPSKAGLAFVHGLAEYSDRYRNAADYFTGRGFSVYAFDLRGHGKSGGRKNDAATFEQLLGDLERFLQKASEEEGGKIFLVGHSFGGQLVLNYAASRRTGDRIGGVIASSPNIRVAVGISKAKIWAAGFLSRCAPRFSLANEIDASFLSHDPDVVRAYIDDPLISKKITARLGHLILENQKRLPVLASSLRTSCLLMHGAEDRICSPEGTRDFFSKIPIEDKQLVIYEGFYHELFHEIGKERVFHDMEGWIQRHL